jgi:Rdx family
LEAKLIEGSKGIFDVKVNGRMVYSKYATGRHAEPGEIGRLVSG